MPGKKVIPLASSNFTFGALPEFKNFSFFGKVVPAQFSHKYRGVILGWLSEACTYPFGLSYAPVARILLYTPYFTQ